MNTKNEEERMKKQGVKHLNIIQKENRIHRLFTMLP